MSDSLTHESLKLSFSAIRDLENKHRKRVPAQSRAQIRLFARFIAPPLLPLPFRRLRRSCIAVGLTEQMRSAAVANPI